MADLHLSKVAFSCASYDTLARRQQARLADGVVPLVTRFMPKRAEELVGGSLYWIVKHRLIARNSCGEEASIIAIIKTQGSDTKLVAQMQPLYEAQGLQRQDVGGVSVPPLVTQIGDGENGGVMMNEFPSGYRNGINQIGTEGTVAVNVTISP